MTEILLTGALNLKSINHSCCDEEHDQIGVHFNILLTKTFAVGFQKKCFNEAVLLSIVHVSATLCDS